MNPNELYGHLAINKDLVTGFSIMFSRLEYSLKRTPEYALKRNNGVEANWKAFSNDHKDRFDCKRTKQLQKAVEYLLNHPPLKQILNNGVLDWKSTEEQNLSDFEKLILSVTRVRNNLFHGGKFQSMPLNDPGRDADLIKSCNVILEECLFLNNRIREIFYHKD
jgi:hypothetical protein